MSHRESGVSHRVTLGRERVRYHPVDPSMILVFAMRRRRGNRVAESRTRGVIRRSDRSGGRLFFCGRKSTFILLKTYHMIIIWYICSEFTSNGNGKSNTYTS